MQAVRSFVTMALQKDLNTYVPPIKVTTASLYSSIILPFRYADNRFHLFLIRTFGNVVDELLKDIHTFHDFIHTNHVTCPGVSFGIDDFFEIYFVVYSIRLALAHITYGLLSLKGRAGETLARPVPPVAPKAIASSRLSTPTPFRRCCAIMLPVNTW